MNRLMFCLGTRGKGWRRKRNGKVQLYLLTHLPFPAAPFSSVPLHLMFWAILSSVGWSLSCCSTEGSWSLTIPTERDAKVNLARGNGDPAPFLMLPISLPFPSLSVCICACVQAQIFKVWYIPSHYVFFLHIYTHIIVFAWNLSNHVLPNVLYVFLHIVWKFFTHFSLEPLIIYSDQTETSLVVLSLLDKQGFLSQKGSVSVSNCCPLFRLDVLPRTVYASLISFLFFRTVLPFFLFPSSPPAFRPTLSSLMWLVMLEG